MTNSDRFIALCDELLRKRTDWAGACATFRWPEFDEFNWVRDYFDVAAAGNRAVACAWSMIAGATSPCPSHGK